MTTSPETTVPAAASSTPQVVFGCVRNGGRSVISRVLTEHYAKLGLDTPKVPATSRGEPLASVV